MRFAEKTQWVMPGDANPHGTLFGGKLMQWIDECAAIAAYRFAGAVVTASVDSLTFKKPIQVGDLVTLKAAVNRAWNTSMEVGVKVWAEDKQGNSIVACKAYLTFVAVSPKMVGVRRPIQKEIEPEGAIWWKRYNKAEERRQLRLTERER